MRDAERRSHAYENAVVDLVEAGCWPARWGRPSPRVVMESDKEPPQGHGQVCEPAVEAQVTSPPPVPVGEAVSVTLAVADPATRRVSFTL